MSDKKVALVTGASNGLGEVTALALAAAGHHVVLVARSAERLDATLARIKTATPSATAERIVADLSVIAEVKRAAAAFRAAHDRLDVLVNNAGAVFPTRQETKDGLEMTFGLNHMSYFVMVHELADLLAGSGSAAHKARIVNIASGAHTMASDGVVFDDLDQRRRGYSAMRVYGESKLMNLLFTYELARRLAKDGVPVTVNAAHPGPVATGFGGELKGIVGFLFRVLVRPFFRTPEKGARTQIHLALAPEIEGTSGKYFADSKEARSNRFSRDEKTAAELWRVSEALLAKHG